MSYAFKLSCTLPCAPEAVYDAWLTSSSHGAMTGGAAKTSKKVGADHTAWDGYITGKNVELTPGRRIVQSWRTREFPDDHPDSTITLTLSPVKSGTRMTLSHSGVPDGQTSYEQGGWRDHYFTPMKAYFAEGAAKAKRASTKDEA